MNSLDIFGKFKDRRSVSTAMGGITSVLAIACVVILISIHVKRLRSENLHRELKIDFHKVDQHIEAELDLLLPNAPCDIVTLNYKDYLGEDIHDINIHKILLDKDGGSSGSPEFDPKAPITIESVKERAKNYPGCKLNGKFNSVMKVKGVLYVTFRDHFVIYDQLARDKEYNVNLEFKINHMYLGPHEKTSRVQEILSPYHEDIHRELNPFSGEKSTQHGRFMAYMYIQVFPFEVINDCNNGETIHSHQYSYIKNYKSMDDVGFNESPTINFQLDFLPIISVYHIKRLDKFKALVGLLGACGGFFAVFGIINTLLVRVSGNLGKTDSD